MATHWLVLPAFAKINLSLELLGRRADGYWEIRTVYQTISLQDRLRLRLTRRGGVSLRVRGGGAPAGQANLVYKALTRTARLVGWRGGVEAELEKGIPAARGLGGGSSDAAVAIIGLLRLTRTKLDAAELYRLGRSLGADVPFFFAGGRALGVGRGDEVHPVPDGRRQWCLLVCPPQEVSTPAAYRWAGSARAGRLTPRGGADNIASLRRLHTLRWSAGNDFERVVFARFPELKRIRALLQSQGASQAALSGSGSALFALFDWRIPAQRAARRVATAGAAYLVETIPGDTYRRKLGLSGDTVARF